MTDNTQTTQSPASIDAAMRADLPQLRDAFLALSAAYSFAKESVREDGDRSCVHPLNADNLAIVKRIVNRVAIMLEDGTYGAEDFLASVGVTIDVASLRERDAAIARLTRELAERDATIARLTRERNEAYETVDVRIAGTSRGFLASVAVSMGLETHGEAPELHARILAENARLTSERDEATVYSRDVCDAVENVRVMLAGTLDALDAARARLGTVEGCAWPTT